jgi:hypothetical protein
MSTLIKVIILLLLLLLPVLTHSSVKQTLFEMAAERNKKTEY